MDGGACSRDAFRMPSEGEELTTPFSGFVVRYGHSARLAKSTAAIVGLTAELPPRMEVRHHAGKKEGVISSVPVASCLNLFKRCRQTARKTRRTL